VFVRSIWVLNPQQHEITRLEFASYAREAKSFQYLPLAMADLHEKPTVKDGPDDNGGRGEKGCLV
jgi:hypothetical protein